MFAKILSSPFSLPNFIAQTPPALSTPRATLICFDLSNIIHLEQRERTPTSRRQIRRAIAPSGSPPRWKHHPVGALLQGQGAANLRPRHPTEHQSALFPWRELRIQRKQFDHRDADGRVDGSQASVTRLHDTGGKRESEMGMNEEKRRGTGGEKRFPFQLHRPRAVLFDVVSRERYRSTRPRIMFSLERRCNEISPGISAGNELLLAPTFPELLENYQQRSVITERIL